MRVAGLSTSGLILTALLLFCVPFNLGGATAGEKRERAKRCLSLLNRGEELPPECLDILEERREIYERELKRMMEEAEDIDYKLLKKAIYRVGDKFISFLSVEAPLKEVELVEWSRTEGVWICISGRRINIYRLLKDTDPSIEEVLYLSKGRLSRLVDPSSLPQKLYKLVEAVLFTAHRPLDILKVEIIPGTHITIDITGLLKEILE